jgi:hypothetical protein
MVHESGVVPAEDRVSVPVGIAVLVEELPVEFGHAGDSIGRERLVEFVADPGDRSTGDVPRGKDSETNDVIYVTEFRVWMDH